MARLFSRKHKSKKVGGAPLLGQLVEFAADGVAPVTLAADANDVLHQLGSVYEVGALGVYHAEAIAGNATTTITVPSGKYWRLIGVKTTLVADATVDNRFVTYKTQDVANAEIETIIQPAAVVGSATAQATLLYEAEANLVGNEGVAAQGTLSITEPVTATDPFVINGVTFTVVAALTAVNQILLGASEAATKLAFNAAFVDRDNGGVLHSVTDAVYAALGVTAIDFATDDMVFTANVKGVAGNALATTETFTHANNVFDAATLGTTTAGVGNADAVSTLEYPEAGTTLDAGEDLVVTVTDGAAGDALELDVFYIEFDVDPNRVTPTA